MKHYLIKRIPLIILLAMLNIPLVAMLFTPKNTSQFLITLGLFFLVNYWPVSCFLKASSLSSSEMAALEERHDKRDKVFKKIVLVLYALFNIGLLVMGMMSNTENAMGVALGVIVIFNFWPAVLIFASLSRKNKNKLP